MPKGERLTPEEVHGLLLRAGFEWIRSKGSHRIYRQGSRRVVIPFHSGRTLHPKIIKQVRQAIAEEPSM
ncbi:MAG: type II toxin-antitoxin system HicA family toxin [Acidobacteriota bacterium]